MQANLTTIVFLALVGLCGLFSAMATGNIYQGLATSTMILAIWKGMQIPGGT